MRTKWRNTYICIKRGRRAVRVSFFRARCRLKSHSSRSIDWKLFPAITAEWRSVGEGRLGGERGLDEDDEARRRECKRAATILSLSLFLPPLLVRRQLNAPRFIMHETQDLFKEELRVCTRNRATVGDNDGPITGNKRYESGLFSTRLEGLSTRFFLPPSLLSISRVLACNRKGCQRKMLGVFPCVISPSLF